MKLLPQKYRFYACFKHLYLGTYGIIINKISNPQKDLKSGVKHLPPDLQNLFANNLVYRGGLIRRLQVLHTVPECGGTSIPFSSSPLYKSLDIQKAVNHINSNTSLTEQFTWYAGCCCWDEGTLEEQVR